MVKALTWRITIAWGNPYTQPPNGMPRVLAEATLESEGGGGAPRREAWPEVVQAALARPEAQPGRGYMACISRIVPDEEAAARAWSPERKGARRRAELRKRVAKEVGPLFAGDVDELVAREVEARPSYFDGTKQ